MGLRAVLRAARERAAAEGALKERRALAAALPTLVDAAPAAAVVARGLAAASAGAPGPQLMLFIASSPPLEGGVEDGLATPH